MRKNVFGRRLKRDSNERKGLFKSLMSSLVLNERIKTTEEKAKAIKGTVEKLVTKAKKKGSTAKDQLQKYLTNEAINKLVKDVTPRYKDVNGGYTRIVRIGKRFTDNASMVLIEWVEGKSQSQDLKTQNEILEDQEDKISKKAESKKETFKKKAVVKSKPKKKVKK